MNARGFARQRAKLEMRHHGAALRKAMLHLVREARARVMVVDGKTVGYHLPSGEVVCIKRRFRSEEAALGEITGAVRFVPVNPEGQRRPVRAYRCPYCRGWHTTSRARDA